MFFPRPCCPKCASEELEWVESSGDGEVFSYSTVRRSVKFPEFSDDVPYLVGHIDLEEGIRMFSMIVEATEADIQMGTPVEVVFDHVTDEITLPKFSLK
ncbi:Zn-ribbon domain-containing OB-fold protein [Halorubrum trueperi]|uniref:Zn-ribbon domain-containing OB-fold protein n=1 Tax=Halorubrum trueperi TaxID=2004704 RepID=A0ABD5UN75_9EURY